MKDWGTYALLDAHQIAHYPSQFGNSGSAFLLVGGWKEDGVKRSYQVLFSQKGIARRDFVNSWTDWQIVYDTTLLTNSTMLGELANALGAFKIMNDADADIDVLQSGHYRFDTAPTTNATFSENLFNLLCFNNSDRILQVAYRDNDIKYRIKWGVWYGWVSIAINY